jgi:hypothetical protein
MADFKKTKSRNIRKRRKSSDSESDSDEEDTVYVFQYFVSWYLGYKPIVSGIVCYLLHILSIALNHIGWGPTISRYLANSMCKKYTGLISGNC